MSTLGNDLATIRKQRDLTIEDLHNATKIPRHILEAIEEGSIFTDFDENETYIRSYIRSYAKAAKIPDNRIVTALDQFEAGEYQGMLLEQEEGNLKKRPTFTYDEPAGEESGPDTDTKEDTAEESDQEKDTEEEKEPEYESTSKHIKTHQVRSRSDQQASTASSDHTPPPPSVSSVDWADMGKKFHPLDSRPRIWITGIIVLIAIVAVVLFIIYGGSRTPQSSDPTSATNPSEPAIVPDSLQMSMDTTQAAIPAQSRDTEIGTSRTALPDTLIMLIYAAYDKLEPVRVYTDIMDSLNPYWIEQGEAYRFPFVNEIDIRGQYSRMVLIMNGHVIENPRSRFYNSGTRMLEIDRTLFEGDPRWLQAPPDSLPIDAPPPQIVTDRPTYN